MKAGIFIARLWLSGGIHPVASGGFQKIYCSGDVYAEEAGRGSDGIVNMGFCSKVDNAPDIVLAEDVRHEVGVADVTLLK